jgi:1-acyl-sn-glycerol-3-phosphate acyltransferase
MPMPMSARRRKPGSDNGQRISWAVLLPCYQANVVPHLLIRIMAAIIRVLTWPFVRWEFRGGACLGERDGWIFSSNHRTVFDFAHTVVALEHYGKDARILIASEFWNNPAYVPPLKAVKAIPVYRKTDPRGSFQDAIAALQDGDSICITPEGVLHWDPDHPLELARFKSGVSRMAVGADAPVMPLALIGAERIWPKGTKFPRLNPFRRTTVMCYLADRPLWLSGDDHRANADKVKEVQETLLRQATVELQRIDSRYMSEITP